MNNFYFRILSNFLGTLQTEGFPDFFIFAKNDVVSNVLVVAHYPALSLRLQNGGAIYACPVILQEEVLLFVISIAENWHLSVVDYNTNVAQKPGYRIAKTYYCQCLKVGKNRRYPKYSE